MSLGTRKTMQACARSIMLRTGLRIQIFQGQGVQNHAADTATCCLRITPCAENRTNLHGKAF
ncbi:MAG: hypothetical protein IOC96_16070 [Rhodobacter sp.]|nr:hypothetical protein [Rhodobacter sp.]